MLVKLAVVENLPTCLLAIRRAEGATVFIMDSGTAANKRARGTSRSQQGNLIPSVSNSGESAEPSSGELPCLETVHTTGVPVFSSSLLACSFIYRVGSVRPL